MVRAHDRTCPHQAAPPFERKPIISSSYRNRLARTMPEYEDPEPPADFQVAGSLTPAVNGAYYETGTYNGQPYYRRRNGQPWFIWYVFEGPVWDTWYITHALGGDAAAYWRDREAGMHTPAGNFTPMGAAVGTAVVTAY